MLLPLYDLKTSDTTSSDILPCVDMWTSRVSYSEHILFVITGLHLLQHSFRDYSEPK